MYLVIGADEAAVEKFYAHFPGKVSILQGNQGYKAVSS
jgi:hypothetical protein